MLEFKRALLYHSAQYHQNRCGRRTTGKLMLNGTAFKGYPAGICSIAQHGSVICNMPDYAGFVSVIIPFAFVYQQII